MHEEKKGKLRNLDLKLLNRPIEWRVPIIEERCKPRVLVLLVITVYIRDFFVERSW